MEKTKRQLRAEAVERLESSDPETTADFIRILLDGLKAISPGKVRAALIELLSDDKLPEGDAVSVLINASNDATNPEDIMNYICHALHESYCDVALAKLADMVERDYVLRSEHDKNMLVTTSKLDRWKSKAAKLKAERDELQNKLEHDYANCEDYNDLALLRVQAERERDEWKAKAEQAQESYLCAKDERDAWMAKAEGSSKVRVGQSNLEWLYEIDSELAGYIDGYVVNKGYVGIDTPQWACEWLMAPHANDNLTQESDVRASDVDANDDKPTFDVPLYGWRESCGQHPDQGERKPSSDCESDSREKIEADIHRAADEMEKFTHGECFINTNKILTWLDRQAEITHAECERICDTCEWPSLAAQPDQEAYDRIAELQEKVDELTADLETARAKNRSLRAHISKMQDGRHGWHVKYGKLAEQLRESNRERERLRKQLGIALDHAYDMIKLVNLDGDA